MKKVYGSKALALAVLILMLAAVVPSLHAQTFYSVPGLSFTKTFAGANPLPQVLTAASNGANFNSDATASTNSGGSWLVLSPASGVEATPAAWVVSVNPDTSLAAGTYTGQVVIKQYPSGTPTMTVPVTLLIAATGTPFFDDMAGEVSFSAATGGVPPAQAIQIRNGGSGVLNWTATAATADGGAWLHLSVASGKAPATVSVSLVPSVLPGGGLVAGTWVGLITFQSASTTVTVPVRVSIGTTNFSQANPLNFTMPFAGLSPLPQILSISTTGTAFNFYTELVATGNGGNWLTLTPATGVHGTPSAFSVSIANASALPAGTYTGEIIFFEYPNNTVAMTVPVTLTIRPATAAFFDNLAGGLSYFLPTGGTVPTQSLQIRNGGAGTLKWTGTKSTGDGGAWLTLSTAAGTAPSIVNVGIVPSKLPGGGLIAGTYCGQLVFSTTGDVGTVPVCAVVGDSIFRQENPISFTMTQGGPNPLPQVLNHASNHTSFNFYRTVAATGTGGSWLSTNPAAGVLTTPEATTVSVDATTLPAGTYTGEVSYFEYPNNTMALTVPVTLTIVPPASRAYFDDLPGGLSFYTAGSTPPAQTLQIRNAGIGTLSWTGTVSTSDGGKWLVATPLTGTAPATVTVSIVPANLPSAGLVAGTYCGELTFQTAGDVGTVPVCAVVGPNSFEQVNPLSFTMTTGGGNPLPQSITLASSGTNFNFYVDSVSTAKGGSWLKIAPSSGVLATPEAVTVSVSAATLPAGTYTGEIVFSEYPGNTMSVTVPVTLTVAPAASAYFDNLPGELSFFLKPGGKPPVQPVQIRNAGTGTLNWTGSTSTADGGKWLTLSAASGAAGATVNVGITPANLPGGGLVAGTYCGQVVFLTAGDSGTIPVCATVGPNVFNQMQPLSFNMPLGGSNPLPQVISLTSTGTNFNFYNAAVSTSKGGNWLTLSATTGVFATPEAFTVSVNASALPVGTYTGEIIFAAYPSNGMAITIPVSLTITSCGPFFDAMPGLMSFSFPPSSTNPPAQTLQIRAAGAGSLAWKLVTSTSDGGAWLSVAVKAGTAPSTVTVKIVNSALPGSGLVAGSFNGQLLFQSSGGNVTVPVTVVVGPNGFTPLPPLNFNMNLGGATPAPQAFSVTSTGTAFNFYTVAVATGKGGNWLKSAPATGVDGTPTTITATVNGSGLQTGVYEGEIVFFEYPSGTMEMIVPVTLTVTDPRVPATITTTSGTPQGTVVNTAFTNLLVATVHDASAHPVSGVLVTFNSPTTGASGSFACGNTAITNANGVATSQVYKANTVAGKYTVTAKAAALTTAPGFAMTNNPGPPAAIAATAGTPQSATVNTAFTTNLAATVTDVYGNATPGKTVTFTVPSSGASGTFAGGVNTATTNAQGVATAAVLTANAVAGTYSVTADIGTLTSNPDFALTNLAGPPASVTATGGTPQTAAVNTAFANPLEATVKDSFGNAVPGAVVTFTAPASGASGTFAGGLNTATTNAAGVATSAVFTANGTAGSYAVTGKSGTVTTAPGFQLKNQ